MIKFGADNTLIAFVYRYYKCGGSENINERGLTIGGYQLAWFADLVASFILDNTEDLFINTTSHYRLYRDNWIIFLIGKWPNDMIYK